MDLIHVLLLDVNMERSSFRFFSIKPKPNISSNHLREEDG